MSVLLKRGVWDDIKPVMNRAVGKIAGVYAAYGQDLIITSMREGTHGNGSLHYLGFAVDCRKGKVPISAISMALGADFDCIDESNHYHIEFDPK